MLKAYFSTAGSSFDSPGMSLKLSLLKQEQAAVDTESV